MCVKGPTWLLGGDVERRTAGSEAGAVFCSDWDQVDRVALQAREQSRGGADSPHSPRFSRAWASLPEKNLRNKEKQITAGRAPPTCSSRRFHESLEASEASLLLNNLKISGYGIRLLRFIHVCWNWGTHSTKVAVNDTEWQWKWELKWRGHGWGVCQNLYSQGDHLWPIRQGQQSGKCQTDGLRVATFSSGCTGSQGSRWREADLWPGLELQITDGSRVFFILHQHFNYCTFTTTLEILRNRQREGFF